MSRAELEEERQFLLDSLRDLEREREDGEIGEDDYESLRDDYTARAAEVLRALEAYDDEGTTAAIDEDGAPAPLRALPGGRAPARARRQAPRRSEPLPPSRHSGSRRMMAIVLILGFVVVAGASVFVMAAGRDPGAPVTGSVPQTSQGKLELAHQLESQGQAVEALKLYDEVLAAEPANVEALTYRGWLLKLAGLADQAQASLDRAVTIDPSYPDARFFRGMLLYQDRANPAAAIPEFEAYLSSNPPAGTVEAVQGVLNRARQDLAATTTTAP